MSVIGLVSKQKVKNSKLKKVGPAAPRITPCPGQYSADAAQTETSPSRMPDGVPDGVQSMPDGVQSMPDGVQSMPTLVASTTF